MRGDWVSVWGHRVLGEVVWWGVERVHALWSVHGMSSVWRRHPGIVVSVGHFWWHGGSHAVLRVLAHVLCIELGVCMMGEGGWVVGVLREGRVQPSLQLWTQRENTILCHRFLGRPACIIGCVTAKTNSTALVTNVMAKSYNSK